MNNCDNRTSSGFVKSSFRQDKLNPDLLVAWNIPAIRRAKIPNHNPASASSFGVLFSSKETRSEVDGSLWIFSFAAISGVIAPVVTVSSK